MLICICLFWKGRFWPVNGCIIVKERAKKSIVYAINLYLGQHNLPANIFDFKHKMATHNDTGDKGEQLAAAYLIKKGFTLLARNYRYKKAEIDIIAQTGNLYVFVEVKTRTTNRHGYPEEFVSQKKIDLFLLAAEEFIHQHNWQHDIRFDIISVTGTGASIQIHHIEDAFH